MGRNFTPDIFSRYILRYTLDENSGVHPAQVANYLPIGCVLHLMLSKEMARGSQSINEFLQSISDDFISNIEIDYAICLDYCSEAGF